MPAAGRLAGVEARDLAMIWLEVPLLFCQLLLGTGWHPTPADYVVVEECAELNRAESYYSAEGDTR